MTHFVAVEREVTERKAAFAETMRPNSELEARAEQSTAQLMAVNNELEAFAYSVSHDPRVPVGRHGAHGLFCKGQRHRF